MLQDGREFFSPPVTRSPSGGKYLPDLPDLPWFGWECPGGGG